MASTALMGFLVAFWIFMIVIIFIPMIIGLWVIYKKAREPGWAAIVPLYQTFVLFKITWGNGWYCIMALIPTIIYDVMSQRTIRYIGSSVDPTVSGLFWAIYILLFVVILVISIITLVKLSTSFGKGGGWACGLIFLSPIFLLITAFNKNIVYVGVSGKMPSSVAECRQQNQIARSGHGKVKYCPKCGKIIVNYKNGCCNSKNK